MTLSVIAIAGIIALISRFLGKYRRAALLIASVVALYALQSAGLDQLLPTATLLLVVGTWWIVVVEPTHTDYGWLIAVTLIAAVTSVVSVSIHASKGLVGLSILPIFGVASLVAAGTGVLIPRTEADRRRRVALVFIVGVGLLLAIIKLPLLQQLVTGTVAQITNQSFPLDWQWFGFSYIAFRLLHVLLDFRSGVLHKRLATLPFVDFALYVIFFPALAAGPIDRIERFTKDLDNSDPDQIGAGLIRIGTGLFKKFVLADMLAYIALSPQLVEQSKPNTVLMWIMLYAYAFRLFFDFAGYTDIAIGIGLLAGIKLPENFNAPYLKRNITAFWNNWHMTLSTWFRNYIFTPLSRNLMGSRLKSHKMWIILIAQVVTMVMIGLWHGAAWNFVLWGLWHGVGLWFHKWLTDHTRGWDAIVQANPALSRTVHVLSVVTTFHFVAIGWVFFALPSLPLIEKALTGLVGR